jgi:hypothetical protein
VATEVCKDSANPRHSAQQSVITDFGPILEKVVCMATSRRRPFGSSASPVPKAEAISRALDAIGHLSSGSAKDELRRAQGHLYEAQRADGDPARVQMAARLIRATGVELMKVAAGLEASSVRVSGGRMRDTPPGIDN